MNQIIYGEMALSKEVTTCSSYFVRKGRLGFSEVSVLEINKKNNGIGITSVMNLRIHDYKTHILKH